MADGAPGSQATTRNKAQGKRYAAFVSYSHADETIANWLHRRLEDYRIPAPLRRDGRRRIGKLFRDRVELSAAHDLGGEIRKALERSDALILLCSPRAAKSRYVEEEIRQFKERGGAERIFAVIVDGEPHAAGKPGRTADEECFPRALLYRVDETGALTSIPELNEPIAADVRTGRDGRENGALKLIAGLLGVGLDELVQREKQAERARRLRTQLVAAGFAVLAAGAAIAGGMAWLQGNLAEERRILAEAKTREAEANEQRAIKGEKDAEANAAEANRQRLEAERAATEREIQRALADANAAEATANARQARNTLHRFFTTRAWEWLDDGDLETAARYALAGARLSPANLSEYEAVLARVMHDTPEPQFTLRHDAEIQDVDFPGSRVIATGKDGIVRIWNADNGSEVRAFGIGERIRRTVVSSRGSHILTVGLLAARVNDGFTGDQLHVLSRPGHMIMDAGLSPEGLRAVTLGASGDVVVWSEGKVVHVLQDIAGKPEMVAFTPDGTRIVTAGGKSTPQIWDAATGARLFTLDAQKAKVLSVAFTPDNTRIVTASDDNVVRLWDVETGALLLSRPDQRGLRAAAPSPDRNSIATVNSQGVARLWRMDDPEYVWQVSGCYADELEFSRDGRWLTCLKRNADSLALADSRVLEAASGRGANLEGVSPAFSVLSDRVAIGSGDGAVRIFPLAGRRQASVDDTERQFGKGVFSPDGQGVLIAQSNAKVVVWDANFRNGRTLGDHGAPVTSAGFSPDGKYAVSTGGREARIWDADRPRLVASLAHDKNVTYAAFSPDSSLVVTTSVDGSARVWRVSDGALQQTVSHAVYGVYGVAFSPAARQFATAGADGHVRLWDFSGRQIRSFETPNAFASSVAFSPDGERILAGVDGDIRVWNVATGVLELSIAAGHDVVNSVAISRTGERILSAHLDGSVHVWESRNGRLIASLDNRGASNANAVFSSDDSRILASSRPGKVQLWDARRLTQTFSGGLAQNACNYLGEHRRFHQQSIDADPLLRSEWPVERDVCEGVPGVAPLKPT